MKILRFLAMLSGLVALGGADAGAQSDVALRMEAGGGVEYLSGGQFSGSLRMTQTAGAELSWATRDPSLSLTVEGQGEWHPLNGPSQRCGGTAPGGCAYWVPSLLGGQALVGARYAVYSRLSIGVAVGLGYLDAVQQADFGAGPVGSRVYSIRADMAFAVTDHITFVGRAEQLEMPDYGGVAITGRPVTLLVRFR